MAFRYLEFLILQALWQGLVYQRLVMPATTGVAAVTVLVAIAATSTVGVGSGGVVTGIVTTGWGAGMVATGSGAGLEKNVELGQRELRQQARWLAEVLVAQRLVLGVLETLQQLVQKRPLVVGLLAPHVQLLRHLQALPEI